VLAVETESADDAYGLLSCRPPATETFKIGGETRVDRRDGLHLHCWQGKSYIRVDLAEGGPEITEQAIRLLLNITGRIAKEDLPALVAAVPSDSSGLQRKWLLRHLAACRRRRSSGVSARRIKTSNLGALINRRRCTRNMGATGRSVWSGWYAIPI
jgi:hypothetical protein